MKKKIILFLSFLMIAMCLTGCSKKYVIEEEKINEITQIANNVVTQKGYELPEGYTVSYPDNTTNAQIMIRNSQKDSNEFLEVTFDISTEKIKLIQISVESILVDTIIISWIFGMIFVGIVQSIVNKCNKKTEIKKEKE